VPQIRRTLSPRCDVVSLGLTRPELPARPGTSNEENRTALVGGHSAGAEYLAAMSKSQAFPLPVADREWVGQIIQKHGVAWVARELGTDRSAVTSFVLSRERVGTRAILTTSIPALRARLAAREASR
jgi:hypothetical protein